MNRGSNNPHRLRRVLLPLGVAICLQVMNCSRPALHGADFRYAGPVTFEQVLSIGESGDDDLRYILGRPESVISNNNGDIFIADSETFSIKVYSPEGIYKGDIANC
jgi:hypothetical protein